MRFNQLGKILQEDCGLDASKPLVLGFSGGPDSFALLHALHSLGYQPLVAHFDHGLRPDSAADAHHAENVATAYDVPFFSERVDVNTVAKERKLSIEEAARELRYAFLFRVAGEQGGQAVAVAHTADDQAETVLMHLLRGAGAAGLRGMVALLLPNPWSDSIPLVRPLLGIWRDEVLHYCQENHLQPLQDPTNNDTIYFRNRLRHELLPLLEDYAPGFKSRLHHSAELLQADYALLESLTDAAWTQCFSQRGDGYLSFQRAAFLAEPLSLQRALLRRAFSELRPAQRNLGFDAAERAVQLIRKPEGSAPIDWVGGLYLLVEPENVWIAEWGTGLPAAWPQAPGRQVILEVPGTLQLNAGWKLIARETHDSDLHKTAMGNRDPFQAWLDRKKVGDELIMRRPRPGDRFQPLGMPTGSLKLSDFFINRKLPRRARAVWPLLCKGNEIVWVPGYCPAHPFRIRDETARALCLQLMPA